MKKFALLSHVLPPSPSGQSVMLYRILSRIDPADYYLVSSQARQAASDSLNLPCQGFTLPPAPALGFGGQRIRNLVNLATSILARASGLLALLRRQPVQAIIACTGDLADIPAAFIASRLAGIPFYAYIFDDYVYQWTGNYRRFAEKIAPYIFKRAQGILGPNEFICDEYARRYGARPALVRNPCDSDELTREPFPAWPAEQGKLRIIYTGAVYHANYDCFRNLLAALGLLAEHPLELHIFTAQTRAQLQEQGIAGDNIFVHSHVPYDEILREQRRADLLFLPLAFDSPIPEVIRTSAPGKLGEYLASGRPVLAHVPADSFVADYCARHACAALARQNDPAALAREIERIIQEPGYRRDMTQNAQTRAQADFSPAQASAAFLKAIS